MTNGNVCNYVETLADPKGINGDGYVSEKFVSEGYGQSCGGYLLPRKKDGSKPKDVTQKTHFLSYYGHKDKAEKKPSHGYLRCPQLILFIAEVAGVPCKNVQQAYKLLGAYESNNGLRGSSEKNGNYVWGKEIFRNFKAQLHIGEVTKIIGASANWEEVMSKVIEASANWEEVMVSPEN